MSGIASGERLAGFRKGDVNTAASLVEVDVAVRLGVDGVILAHVNVVTGVPLGAALADDDVSCHDNFAAEFLDAEALAA